MIFVNNPQHWRAIADAAGCQLIPTDVVFSREDGGRLMGGMIFTGYTQRSINVHIAGFHSHWLSRDLLWMVFDYAFNQAKCEYLFAEIRSSNPKVLDMATKIGFTEVARIPDVYPDGDLIVTRMHRDDCKWLGIKPRSTHAR